MCQLCDNKSVQTHRTWAELGPNSGPGSSSCLSLTAGIPFVGSTGNGDEKATRVGWFKLLKEKMSSYVYVRKNIAWFLSSCYSFPLPECKEKKEAHLKVHIRTKCLRSLSGSSCRSATTAVTREASANLAIRQKMTMSNFFFFRHNQRNSDAIRNPYVILLDSQNFFLFLLCEWN